MTIEEITKTIQIECELAHYRMREYEYYLAPLDRGYDGYTEWTETDSGFLMYASEWCALEHLRHKLHIPEDPTLPERAQADAMLLKANTKMFKAMEGGCNP